MTNSNRIIKFRTWDGRQWWNDVAIYNSQPYVWNYEETCLVPLFTEEQKQLYGTPVLCQFTGLLDKNGVEIYEGDIVQVQKEDGGAYTKPEKWAVKYDEESADYRVYNPKKYKETSFWALNVYTTIEVMGNIFEHIHLLKTK